MQFDVLATRCRKLLLACHTLQDFFAFGRNLLFDRDRLERRVSLDVQLARRFANLLERVLSVTVIGHPIRDTIDTHREFAIVRREMLHVV